MSELNAVVVIDEMPTPETTLEQQAREIMALCWLAVTEPRPEGELLDALTTQIGDMHATLRKSRSGNGKPSGAETADDLAAKKWGRRWLAKWRELATERQEPLDAVVTRQLSNALYELAETRPDGRTRELADRLDDVSELAVTLVFGIKRGRGADWLAAIALAASEGNASEERIAQILEKLHNAKQR